MAIRLTGRSEILLPRCISPDQLAHLRNCCLPVARLTLVDYDSATGALDLADLQAKLSPSVAGVYFENPSYFGIIESQGAEISALAHAAGALSIVGVDAVSLGVLAAPADYGADIVCGEAQGLGNHMQYGGGQLGFIATDDKPEYVAEYPSMLVSIAPGLRDPGEIGFGMSTTWRTSYNKRGEAHDYTGTTQWLWGITAGVYLALMGPQGMRELGEAVMQKSHYAMRLLSQIDGVRAPRFQSAHFKEFVVSVDDLGKTVREINEALLDRGILGGVDLSAEEPELGNSALYCVTEAHTQEDIERLAVALEEVIRL